MRRARRFVSSNFHELRVFVRRAELALVPARSDSRTLIFSFPVRNRLQVIDRPAPKVYDMETARCNRPFPGRITFGATERARRASVAVELS